MKKSLRRPVRRYAAMTEYIIILALVAVGSIAVFNIFGDQIRSVIGNSSNQMAGKSTSLEAKDVEESDVQRSIGDF